ncbi:uncharacterized protein LOC135399928 [Ornithodoros turicata]|uniref:uncharacterized protein LOC135399928 n=1 Tax=Ornithodoros turicata TaxID=34597 RepID=UPI00313A07F6
MTLVLSPMFHEAAMPCSEGDVLDLESALLGADWLDVAQNFATNNDLKRKAEDEPADVPREAKRPSPCPEEVPRRKGPTLWSPRLRWKDERRRVLKISMSKMKRIEDPELFLRRSVLVNNTVKKLQREIRDERQRPADDFIGEDVPPRRSPCGQQYSASVLDSVVYHSLLASLES